MANHSAAYPDGRLDRETLKSFFAISGDNPDKFVYKQGWERIPDNWYRRAIGNDYDRNMLEADANAGSPEFDLIGGNVGKPNSFTGVNLSGLTHGVYTDDNVKQGNNLMCFAYRLPSSRSQTLFEVSLDSSSASSAKLRLLLTVLNYRGLTKTSLTNFLVGRS